MISEIKHMFYLFISFPEEGTLRRVLQPSLPQQNTCLLHFQPASVQRATSVKMHANHLGNILKCTLLELALIAVRVSIKLYIYLYIYIKKKKIILFRVRNVLTL